jgi:hypothetical protein
MIFNFSFLYEIPKNLLGIKKIKANDIYSVLIFPAEHIDICEHINFGVHIFCKRII